MLNDIMIINWYSNTNVYDVVTEFMNIHNKLIFTLEVK